MIEKLRKKGILVKSWADYASTSVGAAFQKASLVELNHSIKMMTGINNAS